MEGAGVSAPGDSLQRKRGATTDSAETVSARESAENWAALATRLYPVYVLLGGALGLWRPQTYRWFLAGAPTSFSLALGFIMAAMGLTLRLEDLRSVLVRRPALVLFGCACQYLLMPLSALLVLQLIPLPPNTAAGLILLACCPGGTASNVVTLIAEGDVPLSVLMTLVSTLAAAAATPVLTFFLIGSSIPISLAGLAASTLKVVLLPLLLGAFLQSAFPRAAASAAHLCPLAAVLVSSVLASSVFSSTLRSALSVGSSVSAGPQLAELLGDLAPTIAAVSLLHFVGFVLGYVAASGASTSEAERRAISIEVGMQNSSLGVVLALQHLPGSSSALPAAISAIIMNVMGSTLGAAWGLQARNKQS